MAINFPGPYELRINYTTVVSTLTYVHQMRLSMDMSTAGDPGDPFSDFTCLSRQGATPELEAFTDNLIAELTPSYQTNAEFVSAELWKYAVGTFDAAFQSVYGIGEAGTGGTGTIVDGQGIITFRAQLGGVAKVDLRQSIHTAGATVSIGNAPTAIQDLAAFLTGLGSPMIARDNSYVFAALNWLPGLNERAFKKRLR